MPRRTLGGAVRVMVLVVATAGGLVAPLGPPAHATTGDITEFPVPTASSESRGIAPGPDGSLWFTEEQGNHIGRISTSGAVTEFAVPTASSGPHGIAPGPDGNLWFTERGANKIGRVTTTGTITEFPVPTASSQPKNITT